MGVVISVTEREQVEISEGFCGGVCLTSRGGAAGRGLALFMRSETAENLARALLKQAKRG